MGPEAGPAWIGNMKGGVSAKVYDPEADQKPDQAKKVEERRPRPVDMASVGSILRM